MKLLRQVVGFVLCLSVSATSVTFASKPVEEKSFDACQKLLNGRGQLRVIQPPAPSTLIPLNLLLGSTKCNFIPSLWRWSMVYAKPFPTAGLTEMYRTAETAADSLINQLGVKAVTPIYNAKNLWQGAEATLALMRSDNPPEYIRKGLLIRDNVVIVVPILKRVVKKSKQTGKPVYMPIVTKGHQELENNDVLAAAFAAWALEPWQGKLPSEADLFLEPMVQKRKRSTTDPNSHFTIRIEDYIPQVQEIYENFMKHAEKASYADSKTIEEARPERRCTQCNTCPWASFCRTKLNAAKDLSMMPMPPTLEQAELLGRLGYGDLEKLSKLDINSEAFIGTAITVGVSPDRLKYFVAHALASELGTPLLIEPFQDPVAGFKNVIHADFEDLLQRNIRSGVYLFGSQIQPISGKNTKTEKHFVFAKALDQSSIDAAWAEWLTWLKTHPKIKDLNYVIPIYSKHESVKIEQEFDILKQAAENFSGRERASPFYSEIKVGQRTIGRLIRRKDFFKDHPEVAPEDVFRTMDKTLDILDYIRNNFAFPSYTNSIKYTSKYATDLLKEQDEGAVGVSFKQGLNGLESMAWAKEAYATGEPEHFEKIRSYNELDIDGNLVMLNFIRLFAEKQNGKTPTEDLENARHQDWWKKACELLGIKDSGDIQRLVWKPEMKALAGTIDEIVKIKRHVSALRERHALLKTIMGKEVSSLSKKDLEEFEDILDRRGYLKRRQEIQSDKDLSEKEADAQLQSEKFNLDSNRQARLFEFFKAQNPKLDTMEVGAHNAEAFSALATLFSTSASYLTPTHIREIRLIETLGPKMAKLKWQEPANMWERLVLPKSFQAALGRELARAETKDDERTIERLWKGLYYDTAFATQGHNH